MKQFGTKLAVFGVVFGIGVLALASTVLARPPSPTPDPVPVPFATECSTSDFDSAGRAECFLDTVPAGYHFEIRTVTGQFELSPGVKPIQIDMQIVTGAGATDNFFPAAFQGDSAFFFGDYYTVNQAVQLNANGGTAPFFTIVASNAGTGFASLTAAGVLIPD